METFVTKICPKCHNTAGGLKVDEKAFCEDCGTELVGRPKCACGREYFPYHKFCRSCGAKLPEFKKKG
jgi:hypothetical protein